VRTQQVVLVLNQFSFIGIVTMESLFSVMRQQVSQDKNRFSNGEFDLDLTYITDRVIGKSDET
jgi:hypothetical protein